MTRSNVFQDGWEIGEFHAADNEAAFEKIRKMAERHDIGEPLTIKLSLAGKMIRMVTRNK